MKKDSTHLFILIGLITVALIVGALLVLNVYTVRHISYLDRFFSAVSEEYRAAKSEEGLAVVENTVNDSGATCISADLDLGSDPFIGDPNAPVVIVEYSDFECPFCARYFTDSYGLIKQRYIDTGLARLYFKDFPLDNIHPLARPASIAANCLYDQRGPEAFFAFHDRLFELQGNLISNDNISNLVMEQGLDAATLAACMGNPQYDNEINDDLNEGGSVGITGTPSFVINGELVIGALPFAEFERVIENALAGNGCQQG